MKGKNEHSARPSDNGRRRFFKHLSAMGAAAAAGVLSKRRFVMSEDREATPQPSTGYRPTDHIRKYYEKAKLI